MTPDQQLLHDFGEAVGTHDAKSIAVRLNCSWRAVYDWRAGKNMSGFAREAIRAHIDAIKQKGE